MKTLATALLVLAVASPIQAQRRFGGPNPGDTPPDFTLNTKDGKSNVTLSNLTGRPTALIFASYT